MLLSSPFFFSWQHKEEHEEGNGIAAIPFFRALQRNTQRSAKKINKEGDNNVVAVAFFFFFLQHKEEEEG